MGAKKDLGRLATQPPTSITPYRAQQLEARARVQMVEPAKAVGQSLPVLGLTPRPTGSELVTVAGQPWLLAAANNDPLAAAHGGRLVVPKTERDRLIDLIRAGVHADLVWIAHELPAGTSEKNLARVALPANAALASFDRGVIQAVKTFMSAAAVAAAAPFAALGGLDPVLLGGALDKDGHAVCWVELARWTW